MVERLRLDLQACLSELSAKNSAKLISGCGVPTRGGSPGQKSGRNQAGQAGKHGRNPAAGAGGQGLERKLLEKLRAKQAEKHAHDAQRKSRTNSTKQPPPATGVRLGRLAQASALLAAIGPDGYILPVACAPDSGRARVPPHCRPSGPGRKDGPGRRHPHQRHARQRHQPSPGASAGTNATAPRAAHRQAELDKREADLRTLERELGSKPKT